MKPAIEHDNLKIFYIGKGDFEVTFRAIYIQIYRSYFKHFINGLID